MSPVGWSTFATGVDPSGHNIFDFLSRDKVTHLPVLSSTRLNASPAQESGPSPCRAAATSSNCCKRSKPFWKTCAEAGVASSILRVPITFPPDKFGGKHAVGHVRARPARHPGHVLPLHRTGERRRKPVAPPAACGWISSRPGDGTWTGRLLGPDLSRRYRQHGRCPSRSRWTGRPSGPPSTSAGETFTLGADEYSDWIPVELRQGHRGKAHGICKVRITSFEPGFSFYVTPVHIDPRQPAMPISNPPHFAIALSRLQGRFATLGLAEDTWALNERVIDEQAFLDQAYGIHEERKAQFFHALDRQPDGVVSVVFDATDRIQHMFFRYLRSRPSGQRGKDTESTRTPSTTSTGRPTSWWARPWRSWAKDDALLIVISDHGFKPASSAA